MLDSLIKPASLKPLVEDPASFDLGFEGQILVDSQSKQLSFAVVGPPKSGKTTLARSIESSFGCVYIQDILLRGESIDELLTLSAVVSVLSQEDVLFRGYVLDDLPQNNKQAKFLFGDKLRLPEPPEHKSPIRIKPKTPPSQTKPSTPSKGLKRPTSKQSESKPPASPKLQRTPSSSSVKSIDSTKDVNKSVSGRPSTPPRRLNSPTSTSQQPSKPSTPQSPSARPHTSSSRPSSESAQKQTRPSSPGKTSARASSPANSSARPASPSRPGSGAVSKRTGKGKTEEKAPEAPTDVIEEPEPLCPQVDPIRIEPPRPALYPPYPIPEASPFLTLEEQELRREAESFQKEYEKREEERQRFLEYERAIEEFRKSISPPDILINLTVGDTTLLQRWEDNWVNPLTFRTHPVRIVEKTPAKRKYKPAETDEENDVHRRVEKAKEFLRQYQKKMNEEQEVPEEEAEEDEESPNKGPQKIKERLKMNTKGLYKLQPHPQFGGGVGKQFGEKPLLAEGEEEEEAEEAEEMNQEDKERTVLEKRRLLDSLDEEDEEQMRSLPLVPIRNGLWRVEYPYLPTNVNPGRGWGTSRDRVLLSDDVGLYGENVDEERERRRKGRLMTLGLVLDMEELKREGEEEEEEEDIEEDLNEEEQEQEAQDDAILNAEEEEEEDEEIEVEPIYIKKDKPPKEKKRRQRGEEEEEGEEDEEEEGEDEEEENEEDMERDYEKEQEVLEQKKREREEAKIEKKKQKEQEKKEAKERKDAREHNRVKRLILKLELRMRKRESVFDLVAKEQEKNTLIEVKETKKELKLKGLGYAEEKKRVVLREKADKARVKFWKQLEKKISAENAKTFKAPKPKKVEGEEEEEEEGGNEEEAGQEEEGGEEEEGAEEEAGGEEEEEEAEEEGDQPKPKPEWPIHELLVERERWLVPLSKVHEGKDSVALMEKRKQERQKCQQDLSDLLALYSTSSKQNDVTLNFAPTIADVMRFKRETNVDSFTSTEPSQNPSTPEKTPSQGLATPRRPVIHASTPSRPVRPTRVEEPTSQIVPLVHSTLPPKNPPLPKLLNNPRPQLLFEINGEHDVKEIIAQFLINLQTNIPVPPQYPLPDHSTGFWDDAKVLTLESMSAPLTQPSILYPFNRFPLLSQLALPQSLPLALFPLPGDERGDINGKPLEPIGGKEDEARWKEIAQIINEREVEAEKKRFDWERAYTIELEDVEVEEVEIHRKKKEKPIPEPKEVEETEEGAAEEKEKGEEEEEEEQGKEEEEEGGEENNEEQEEEYEEEKVIVKKILKRQILITTNPKYPIPSKEEFRSEWLQKFSFDFIEKRLKEKEEKKKQEEAEKALKRKKKNQKKPAEPLHPSDDTPEEEKLAKDLFAKNSEEEEEGGEKERGLDERILSLIESENEKDDKIRFAIQTHRHIPPPSDSLDESTNEEAMSTLLRQHFGGLSLHPFYQIYCPVHWAQIGRTAPNKRVRRGKVDNAIAYKGFLFLLSSRRRLRQFLANPRRFLQVGPPQPKDCVDVERIAEEEEQAEEEEEEDEAPAEEEENEPNEDQQAEEEDELDENGEPIPKKPKTAKKPEFKPVTILPEFPPPKTAEQIQKEIEEEKKEKEEWEKNTKSGLRIAILGPPLSGKSSLAHVLSHVFNLRLIDPDDLPPSIDWDHAAKEDEELAATGAISPITLAQHIAQSCIQADPSPPFVSKRIVEVVPPPAPAPQFIPPDPKVLAARAAEAEKKLEDAKKVEDPKAKKAKKGKKGEKEAAPKETAKPAEKPKPAAKKGKGVKEPTTPKKGEASGASEVVQLPPPEIKKRPSNFAACLPFAKGEFRGWVLDEFPQTKDQAIALLRAGVAPDIVIVLNGGDDEEQDALNVLKARSKLIIKEDLLGTEKIAIHPTFANRLTLFQEQQAKILHVFAQSNDEYPADEDETPEADEEDPDKPAAPALPPCDAKVMTVPYTLSMHLSHGRILRDLSPIFPRSTRMESYDDVLPSQRVFGWSRHYCPVTLYHSKFLVAGDPTFCCTYFGHVYLFAGADEQAMFIDAPFFYSQRHPFVLESEDEDEEEKEQSGTNPCPPLRLAVVGSHGSGKSTVSEQLMLETGVTIVGEKERQEWWQEEKEERRRKKEIASLLRKAKKEQKKDADRVGKAWKDEKEKAKREAAAAEGKKKKKTDDAEDNEAAEEEDNQEDEAQEEDEGDDGEVPEGEEEEDQMPAIFPTLIDRLKQLKNGFVLDNFPTTAEDCQELTKFGVYPEVVLRLTSSEETAVNRLVDADKIQKVIDQMKIEQEEKKKEAELTRLASGEEAEEGEEEPTDWKAEQERLLEEAKEKVVEKFNEMEDSSEAVCTQFSEARIPVRTVPADRRIPLVSGYVRSALHIHLPPKNQTKKHKTQVSHAVVTADLLGSKEGSGGRDGLLMHAYSVPLPLAVHFLSTGTRTLSTTFSCVCPVCSLNNIATQPQLVPIPSAYTLHYSPSGPTLLPQLSEGEEEEGGDNVGVQRERKQQLLSILSEHLPVSFFNPQQRNHFRPTYSATNPNGKFDPLLEAASLPCFACIGHTLYAFCSHEHRQQLLFTPSRYLPKPFVNEERTQHKWFKYPTVEAPAPILPLGTIPRQHATVSVIGSPLSGKSTVAKALSAILHVPLLTIADVLLSVTQQTHQGYFLSSIGKKINDTLIRGEGVGDELMIEALQFYLARSEIVQSGWILDGFPATVSQAKMMKEKNIIPGVVLVTSITLQESKERMRELREQRRAGVLSSVTPFVKVDLNASKAKKTKAVQSVEQGILKAEKLPLVDTTSLELAYQTHMIQQKGIIDLFRNVRWSGSSTRTVVEVGSELGRRLQGRESGKWSDSSVAIHIVTKAQQQLSTFDTSVILSVPTKVVGVPLLPDFLIQRRSALKVYDPVELKEKNILVNTDEHPKMQEKFTVFHHGRFFYTASKTNMETFLACPSKFSVQSLPRDLPFRWTIPELPMNKSLNDVTTRAAIGGFCCVTLYEYLEGKKKAEASSTRRSTKTGTASTKDRVDNEDKDNESNKGLVRGRPEFGVKYKDQLFLLSTALAMDKFLKQPWKYENVPLPKKLPPAENPIKLSDLSHHGFLEQTLGRELVNALTRVVADRPLLPFHTPVESALLQIALDLKQNNPKATKAMKKVADQMNEEFKKAAHVMEEIITKGHEEGRGDLFDRMANDDLKRFMD
ncbi:putative adenylate/nucleoside-diphosphate kinase [Blattamonas nauphoetae]|uniref:Adenylate/nucleoside-diphosphate kinase n=1 Tax=Blattamonas nauphoetae TaxID=2049346 RepID=A0ABQ9YMB6_9EUKA|nr:putative adenylate/nucleoside-diphosphate kinase [Blattamonas nauphoetae]